MTTKHPPGPPMDLANMRKQGVHSRRAITAGSHGRL